MLLEVNNIMVSYSKVEALRGVSLKVEEGTIVSLLGSNGAGKSTTIKTISGLQHPTSGEIWFRGERIDRLSPKDIVRRGISQVPEGRRTFPSMTVLDNLRVGAYVRKDSEAVKKDLKNILDYFPILSKRQSQAAGTLSGGEQQMLAIGRALMSKPRLLLLDEPSLGLAPLVVSEIAEIITKINQNGVSVLLVEQNALMGIRLAKRSYVMQTGRIILEGTTEELSSNDEVKRSYLGG